MFSYCSKMIFVVSEYTMSVQKVLGLRTHPPCKIVWCLWDGWVMFSKLVPVAVFYSSTEVFCFQAKTIIQCKESVHLRFFCKCRSRNRTSSVILCWVSLSVTQNYELIKTVNISFYVMYFSTTCYSGNRFRLTLVTFRPSIAVKSKVSSWW